MEVSIALGHFCDTHGPCVILCTERSKEIVQQTSSVNPPVCSACESLDANTVFTCQDENYYYITTRMSLNASMTSILKDAVLRSLSIEVVEEKGHKSGTIYFGDSTRGHIISHVFDIKDSMARGFRRKYCIVVIGKHQISLLNHYSFIEKNLKHISEELQLKANHTNTDEHTATYRKHAEQSQNTNKFKHRSLAQLVGEQNVFAHLHMWFVHLLRAEIYRQIPHDRISCPVECNSVNELRQLAKEMSKNVFRTILYCILTGIRVKECNVDIVKHFRQLLPKKFLLPTSGKECKVFKNDGCSWDLEFRATLPKNLPRLMTLIEKAVKNQDMSDEALFYRLMDLVMHWFSIACVMGWAPNSCDELMRSLEVQKYDLPLLAYWIPQSSACVEHCKTDWMKKLGDIKKKV